MKKILLLLALVVSMSAVGQNAVGDWNIHASFDGSRVSNVVETHHWVYYLSTSNLFRLDKETQENESLSIVNDLSDMGISQIYYNSDRDYLVVVYSNSNIDIITSNGTVVNMSEVKDAMMTSSKTINDVTFGGGVIYLATDFGYMVIDENKFVVKESHLYGEPLTSVAQVGDMLLLSSSNGFYYGTVDEYHAKLASFKTASFLNNVRMCPINDSVFMCLSDHVFRAVMNKTGEGDAQFTYSQIIADPAQTMQPTVGGYLLNMQAQGGCYTVDEKGMNPVFVETQGEVCSRHPAGDGSWWSVGTEGLHLKDSENYYLPNAPSLGNPYYMTFNKSKGLLYVSTPSANGVFGNMPSVINTFDGMKWTDVTPDGAPQEGTYWIDFMPDAPDTYFQSTWKAGVLKVTDNKITLKYDTINSPIVYRGSVRYGTMHPVTSIDRNGNLWVVEARENKETPVMVLPAAKTKLEQTTVADWITPTIRNLDSEDTQRSSFLSTRQGNNDIKIYADGRFESPIFMWNSAGQLSVDPEQEQFNSFTDQDGLSFTWTNVVCFVEDLNGIVWMGSTEGVISFNPAQAFSGNFRVNHIKVPRNDGTNMADYLLDGIRVNDVAVDGANRKWIATETSGLFLVSADGSEIIKRFNTTNSPLASNTVYKVCCNPNSNSVYVTTPAGLYEYFSDSSPAESSYDNIYAYPNPVRPEFTGNVTLMGMMDNSLVKIADASGNVIRQMKSTGGMATWDCCDQYGERVKTGVYLVLCSQANGSGEAVVTKIAVIR